MRVSFRRPSQHRTHSDQNEHLFDTTIYQLLVPTDLGDNQLMSIPITMASRKRQVKIRDIPTMIVPAESTLSDKECEQSWWSVSDLNLVKDSVKRQCRGHRQQRRYSDCLSDAYRSACSTAETIQVHRQFVSDDSASTGQSDSSDNTEQESVSAQRGNLILTVNKVRTLK
jgi:hypothetical protein